MPDVTVNYRAGDQPNNAFSLNVLNPGEVAATAGTSGVVYGVSNQIAFDPKSRVNTFIHVNNSKSEIRNGVLLCINGTGILNSWLRKNLAPDLSYEQINEQASRVPEGSDGVYILPFGNGAERVLENAEPGCSIHNLNFNIHNSAHLLRAAQEGIAFSFYYGMKIMEKTGIKTDVIKAGFANMFLSHIFTQTLANVSGAKIELYNTDGSTGAARGSGVGSGIYKSVNDAFSGLECIKTIYPESGKFEKYQFIYSEWRNLLKNK